MENGLQAELDREDKYAIALSPWHSQQAELVAALNLSYLIRTQLL